MKAIVCTKYGPPDVLQLKEAVYDAEAQGDTQSDERSGDREFKRRSDKCPHTGPAEGANQATTLGSESRPDCKTERKTPTEQRAHQSAQEKTRWTLCTQ